MSRQSPGIFPAAVFILSQILLFSLFAVMNRNPGLRLGNGTVILILLLVTCADLYYLHYFLSSMKLIVQARYAEQTEENCRQLLASYQKLGSAQKKLETDVHDIVNAQFTYHSLLEQGKTNEAEQFRTRKQREWSESV